MSYARISRYNRVVIARLVQLLAPHYPDLDPTTRASVELDVTIFVAKQIQSMPSFLRLPYRLALVAFDVLPMLRYWKPFVALPDDAAAAYLSLWNDRGGNLTRNFVKLMRSCALLAYFDHPQVRIALDTAQPAAPGPPRAVGNGVD